MRKILALIALAGLSGCASFESGLYSVAEAARAEAARASNGYKSEPAKSQQAVTKNEAVKPVTPAQTADDSAKPVNKKAKPAAKKDVATTAATPAKPAFEKPDWAGKCEGGARFVPEKRYFACSANTLIVAPGGGVSLYTSVGSSQKTEFKVR